MPVSQNEYLWSGATPILLISPARFFVYKGPKIDYFLSTPLDYRLLFVLVSARTKSEVYSMKYSWIRISCTYVQQRIMSHMYRYPGYLLQL